VRDRVAHDLFDLMLHELFAFGLMQTDPNFANYRYAHSGQIVLLDFGATRALGPDVAHDYRALLQAGLSGDRDGMARIATKIGFISDDMDDRFRDQILSMMEMVFEALLADEHYDFADTSLSQKLQAAGMAMAHDGFIPPPLPIDALFLQRKFAGMFLLAARLKAKVPVARLIRGWTEDTA